MDWDDYYYDKEPSTFNGRYFAQFVDNNNGGLAMHPYENTPLPPSAHDQPPHLTYHQLLHGCTYAGPGKCCPFTNNPNPLTQNPPNDEVAVHAHAHAHAPINPNLLGAAPSPPYSISAPVHTDSKPDTPSTYKGPSDIDAHTLPPERAAEREGADWVVVKHDKRKGGKKG